MARQHPKKHYLFKFGKSRSTSNLSAGPAQAHTEGSVSTAETSGNASRGTLSRMRRFLHLSNYSQSSSVTPGVVGASTSGGTQEQQGQSQAIPFKECANQSHRTESKSDQ
ncbi:hypothetical protein BKA82DRAFT_4022801 [Pisolithus tinctorius]|nr:hypothetical protein BKA82DRAFT_4022801 [Pisolithus tinctorius]